MSFVTTWMDLEGIILSKISQRKINTIFFHLYVGSKRQHKQTTRRRPIDTEKADGGQRGGVGSLGKKLKGLRRTVGSCTIVPGTQSAAQRIQSAVS